MTKYPARPVLAIATLIVAISWQSEEAFARVLDASGRPMAEPGRGQVSGDWTPSSIEPPTQALPVFTDAASAHRRATQLVDCVQLSSAKHEAEFRLTWTTQNMSIRDVERHERVLADLKSRIGKLEARNACAGMTMDEVKTNVYPTLLASAKFGDLSAGACYASAISPLPDGANAKDIRAFRTTALQFVKAGIDRGDWRFVEIMTQATGSLRHRFDWFGHLVQPSREQGYRYRKLLRLGATGIFAADLEEELAAIAKNLPPETIQAMDAEAQKDYATHFANGPTLSERPLACEMSNQGNWRN